MGTAVQRKQVLDQRRRGSILKLVREGHENQFPRMDDFEMWGMLQKLGHSLGRDQVATLLQDLEVLDYLTFKTNHNEYSGRVELKEIELTAAGLRFVSAGRSNDDVLFT